MSVTFDSNRTILEQGKSIAFQPASQSDLIDNLPTDETDLDKSDLQVINSLFKENKSNVQKFLDESKDMIIVGILFMIFTLPILDSYIIKFFPSSSTSPYILLGIKCILVMASYFILKNLYLVRK
jgi:hypothetical protein